LLKSLFKWLKAWQHSTMPRRMAFLRSLIGNPLKERKFQWSVTLLRWGLILGLAGTLYVLGEAVGWQDLLQAM
jgi:hypothetical protein